MSTYRGSIRTDAVRSERSWAGSVLRLRENNNGEIAPPYFMASGHMRARQEEREIPDELVNETIQLGIVKSTLRGQNRNIHRLHVADHIVVITAGIEQQRGRDMESEPEVQRQRVGVTTYRHELVGPWSAVTEMQDNTLALNNAYLFLQVLGIVNYWIFLLTALL